jgi:hypothetical protein
MKCVLHFAVPTLGALLYCYPISAQMRVGAASTHSSRVQPPQPTYVRPILRSPHKRMIQAASGTPAWSQVSVVHVVPKRDSPWGNWQFINVGNIESKNGVPGLGFDYLHLAAVRGSFPFNPAIQQEGNGVPNESFRPTFFSENPDFQGVPGLGLDHPHLAAINRNFHFDPAAQQDGLAVNDSSFAPIFFGENSGYSDSIDPSVIQPVQQEFQQQGQQQPQIIVIQQPAPVAGEQLTGRAPQALPDSSSPSMASPIASLDTAAPMPDIGEFIFVRRGGRILHASAFSISGGLLQYVTPEGIRHTISVAELDPEATRQMNEDLGCTVDLGK